MNDELRWEVPSALDSIVCIMKAAGEPLFNAMEYTEAVTKSDTKGFW